MELIPLYKFKSHVLIGLKEDYSQPHVNDGLVVEIDIEAKRIINGPWSGQKRLKFGYYYPIVDSEKEDFLKDIHNSFDRTLINEIIDSLLNPSKESIKSLIWIPERLRKN